MTGPVPPEALRLARAAAPFVNSGACLRILEAAAPAIEAAAEERFTAAVREELAGPLAELGARITREATAAERSRLFVAIRHGISLDKPWRGEALDLICALFQEQP